MTSEMSDPHASYASHASPDGSSSVAGLVARPCPHSQATTIARLLAGVAAHKMIIVAHVDHAAAASRCGFNMRPTDLFIFGNAGVGTSMMKKIPTLAIDLPLKMLVWQTDTHATMLAYNAPTWLASRHGVDTEICQVVRAMTDGLEAIADLVVSSASIAAR